jgi:hypothetical protein
MGACATMMRQRERERQVHEQREAVATHHHGIHHELVAKEVLSRTGVGVGLFRVVVVQRCQQRQARVVCPPCTGVHVRNQRGPQAHELAHDFVVGVGIHPDAPVVGCVLSTRFEQGERERSKKKERQTLVQ